MAGTSRIKPPLRLVQIHWSLHAGGPSCPHALTWAHLHAGMQKQNDGDAGSSFRRPGAGRRINSISKTTIQGARSGSVGSGQHPGSCGSKASTWGDDPGEIRHPGRPAPPWLSLRTGAALPTGLHGGVRACWRAEMAACWRDSMQTCPRSRLSKESRRLQAKQAAASGPDAGSAIHRSITGRRR